MKVVSVLALFSVLGSVGCLPTGGSNPTSEPSQISVYFENENRVVIDGRTFEAITSDRRGDSALTGRKLLGEGGEESEFSVTNLCLTLGCVVMAALAAGLTMGLVSLDEEDVDLVLQQDPMEIEDLTARKELEEDQHAASKLHFFVHHSHWTMVTLLLLNAGANEALPIFLDKLVPSPVIAILISVTAVLIFGEILPTAIFTGPKQLKIASTLAPVVWVAVICTSVISYPISKLLDALLGVHTSRYTKSKMKALIRIQQKQHAKEHGELAEFVNDELVMMHGALNLKSTTAAECATSMGKVRMLSIDAVMDIECMAMIHNWAKSRVPIYDKHPHNVRGFICVKDLIITNPDDKRPIASLNHEKMLVVAKDMNLQDLLNMFQDKKTQIALVCDRPDLVRHAWATDSIIPAHVHMVGVVSIYDVFRCLINEEFKDEQDAAQEKIQSASNKMALKHHFKVLRKYAASPTISRQNSARQMSEPDSLKQQQESPPARGGPEEPLLPSLKE